MNYDAHMPKDPFADDPNDPASFIEDDFDDEGPLEPLTPEERAGAELDLLKVRTMKRLLTPHGILGIFFLCENCEENHYYDWEIMEANIVASLDNAPSPVHEPSAQPDVDAYVSWDYAMGFIDGAHSR